MSQSISSGLSR